MPPYKLELFDYSVMKVLDLITGKVCIFPTKNNQNVKDSIVDYNKEYYDGGLSMFLVLLGKRLHLFFITLLLLKKNASLMDFTQISLVMLTLDSKEEL